MENSVDIKEEVSFEESTKKIKEEWDDWTDEKCEDLKEGNLDDEFAVDIKKIQEKEKIYVWNSFESAQAGSSTDCRSQGNAACMEMYECAICWRQFASSRALKHHLRSHKNRSDPRTAKSHRCQFCDAKFTHRSYLKRHLRVHTGEKPYNCEVCSAKFTQGSYLKRHLRVHTGEKPYQCEVCSARFTEASSLKTHASSHTREKPFQCQICDAKFFHRNSFRAHMRVNSGKTPYECDLCNTKFHRPNILNNHILKIHLPEKSSYLCGHCKLKFLLSDDFKDVMKILVELTTRFPAGETPDECHLCKAKLTNAKPNN